jgi:hypothetical protein
MFNPFDNKNQNANTASSNPKKKTEGVSITYEEIGLFPRSFNRVFDRFLKQLFFDVENLVLQEYRFYRYLFLTTLKCLFLLIFVPLLVNWVAKTYIVRPITEYYWNTQQTEIFLNAFQQKEAFLEMQQFEEKLYFESLITIPKISPMEILVSQDVEDVDIKNSKDFKSNKLLTEILPESSLGRFTLETEGLEEKLKEKITELAFHYNENSIESITNFFADLFSLSALILLFSKLEIQINITKSFLSEVFFGLDDSKISLLILLITDLLVGYHSSNLWELFFEFLFNHYGLPESQTGIFLLVATLPVLLDVLFKYLIFRHLNRASPATVATYHAMIE